MLATSRNQIFLARLISGILFLAVPIVVLALADLIVLQLHPSLLPTHHNFIAKMLITTAFINLACYAIALLVGWSSMKNLPKFVGMLLSLVIIFLITIKGHSTQTWILLAIFTAAAITLTWRKYISTSL